MSRRESQQDSNPSALGCIRAYLGTVPKIHQFTPATAQLSPGRKTEAEPALAAALRIPFQIGPAIPLSRTLGCDPSSREFEISLNLYLFLV